jgi:hypothetical protein
VIFVALDTTTFVHATPPTFTVGAPPTDVKFVPVIVTSVFPATGPATGVTPVAVGAATYVKALAFVAVPPGVVTEIDFSPGDPGGMVAVSVVALATDTSAHKAPPTVTVGVPPATAKFVPVTVITIPPATGPEDGATDATRGSGKSTSATE